MRPELRLQRAVEAAAMRVVAELRTREAVTVRAARARTERRATEAAEATAAVIAAGSRILAGLPVEDPVLVAERRDDLADAARWVHDTRRDARLQAVRDRLGVAS